MGRPSADPRLQPILQPPPQVLVAPPPERPGDFNRLLAQRVKRALEAEDHLHAEAMDVTAVGGTVTLWGTAVSEDERRRAARVATRIHGVNWVENRLVIGSGS